METDTVDIGIDIHNIYHVIYVPKRMFNVSWFTHADTVYPLEPMHAYFQMTWRPKIFWSIWLHHLHNLEPDAIYTSCFIVTGCALGSFGLSCYMSCYVFRIFLAFRPRKNAICYPSGFLNHGGISDDLIKVEGNDEEEEMMSSLDKKFLARHMKPDENFFRCWLLASGNHDENESITGGRCAIRFVHSTMKGINVLVDLLLFLFWGKEQLLLVYFCTALVGASLWPVVPKSHNAAVVAEF